MFKVTVIGEKFPIGQIKLKTLRRMLPKNFETSRVFKISEKKTILIEKGFGKPVLSELEAFLKVNTCRLLSLPSSHFVIYHNDHPAKDFGKDLMPIRLDRDTEPAKIRGQLYLSLFPEIKDEQFQDTTAMICFGKNPFKTPRELKSGVFAGILHETDQIEYYANKLKSAMRDIDTENIKMALKSLPRQILITQPLQNLAKLARIVIEHSKEEQLKVIVNRYHEGDQKTKLVEIFIIKKDYFGLSHDLTSILTSIDIEPLEMKFYPLRENKDTICRCVARFRSFPKTNLELQKEIEVLIEEDEARKTSLDEGGKIYFSYVNIFNAAARLLRSVDQSRNFYGIINVFQSEPEMVKNILTLLRKKADPAYLDEGLDPIEENKEIEKIRSALSKMPAEDSLKSSVLAFFLQFILSIKKTDYFDHNRIREMFTLYLDPSFLKDLLDPEGKLVSFPSDILVNYKTNTPFDVSLTFLTEKKTSGRRYTETKDVSKIQDLPLIETIKRKTVLHDSAFLSIAKKIFPDVSDMSSRSLELFQKIRFHHGFKDFGIASVLDYEYFVLASKALFHPVADDGIPHMEGIYLNDIARKLGIDPLEISRIEVQFLGEGTLKHVTNNILYTPSQYPKSFIIGIDLLSAVARNVHTCQMEYKDFKDYHGKTKLLPEPYGYINLEEPSGLFGIIYKEFLPSKDADIYSRNITKPELLRIFFRNIGKSIGQIYNDTGMNSADLKLSNLIVDKIEKCFRFCDIVPFSNDMAEIMRGFKSIFNEIPRQYRSDALSGILEVGESGREFLGLIREALKNDKENMDDIPSPKALKEIDDLLRSLNDDPESFLDKK